MERIDAIDKYRKQFLLLQRKQAYCENDLPKNAFRMLTLLRFTSSLPSRFLRTGLRPDS